MPSVHGDYDIDDAYIDMQQIFSAGLVTVIGSGASCALGLPGMNALGRHLRDTITPQVAAMPGSTQQSWALILGSLDDGVGLEESLNAAEGDHELVRLIVAETARCVGDAEATAIQQILSSGQPMALSLLLTHTAKTNPIADVITPNYDRLIELAANRARLGVDSMFYGQTFGRLDEARSKHEMLRPPESTAKRTALRLERHPHVRLSKPHGSLDWYFIDGECVRSAWPLTSERRIVVPGSNKYQTGYHMPFDVHRVRATAALDRAKSLLFYGYGFNDDHLQTHLRPGTQIPTLIMAYALSQGARDYIRDNPRALGLEAATVEGKRGTRLITESHQIDIPHAELWDLAVFNKEVLGL